jgi:hypothetical protein
VSPVTDQLALVMFSSNKGVRENACSSSMAPFMLRLLQSVIGDTAMPPDDWTRLAKACLPPGDYLLWKTGFTEL